jgi:hypothetical protein
LHIILFEPAADGRLMFIRRFSDHRSELLEQQPQNGLASASVTAASDWTAAGSEALRRFGTTHGSLLLADPSRGRKRRRRCRFAGAVHDAAQNGSPIAWFVSLFKWYCRSRPLSPIYFPANDLQSLFVAVSQKLPWPWVAPFFVAYEYVRRMADGANYSKRALLAPFRGAEKIGDCLPGVSLPLVAQPPANFWNAFGVQP